MLYDEIESMMPSRIVRTRTFAYVICLAALTLAVSTTGCGAEEDDLTPTERQRRLVGPIVGKFLVEGQRAYERGSYTMALAMTDSAEQYAPELADLHFLRGNVYLQLNQLGVAEAAFRHVMRSDPQYRGARFNMGLIAYRQDKLRDAIDWFKQEDELEANSNVSLELGRAYAKLGEPDSAQTAYEKAIRLDSTNSTAMMWLGQLYEELGEMEQALEASKAGLKLRPDDTDYKYVVGSLLFRLGEVDEAEPYLRSVAADRPWHHGAQFNMGQVLMRLGDEDAAKVYFTQADSAQQIQEKLSDAEEAINRDPNNLQNWVEMALLLREIGEVDRAIEALKIATTLHPRNLHLQSNLALLLMENEEYDAAIGRYRAILVVDSTLADVWLNLGAAYANAGYPDEARYSWEKVQQLKPGHPAAREYLSRISEIRGAS